MISTLIRETLITGKRLKTRPVGAGETAQQLGALLARAELSRQSLNSFLPRVL